MPFHPFVSFLSASPLVLLVVIYIANPSGCSLRGMVIDGFMGVQRLPAVSVITAGLQCVYFLTMP